MKFKIKLKKPTCKKCFFITNVHEKVLDELLVEEYF